MNQTVIITIVTIVIVIFFWRLAMGLILRGRCSTIKKADADKYLRVSIIVVLIIAAIAIIACVTFSAMNNRAWFSGHVRL